jgi:hypothetical protein
MVREAQDAGSVTDAALSFTLFPGHLGNVGQDDGDSDKRRRQEEALDEALKDTFPASDPVSVEQPTAARRRPRQIRGSIYP